MKTKLLFCFIFIVLIFSKVSRATTYTWVGGTSGNWNTNSNWSPGTGYPGSTGTTDVAYINTSNATITYNGTHTIFSFATTNYGVSGLNIQFTGTTPQLTVTNGISMAQPSGASVVLTLSGMGTASVAGTCSFMYQGAMSVTSGVTVNFNSTAIVDFTTNQGTLTNAGTLNFLSGSQLKLGDYSSLANSGTVSGTSATFTLSGSSTPACLINNTGTFKATSCTFTLGGSNASVYNTGAASSFTSKTCTFNINNSGTLFNRINNTGTFRDHGSTFAFQGGATYIQNAGTPGNMWLSGTTITANSNGEGVTNSATFKADSGTTISLNLFQSFITNSGTFYAGTSGSSCIITLSGQSTAVTNTGTFYLGSTSIIYPTGTTVAVTNTSGTFTLQSDALGSAAIAAISSTSSATGTFNVERYFQGGNTYDNLKKRWVERNYRIISSAVNTGTQVSGNYIYGLNYIVGATAGQTTGASSSTNAFITGAAGGNTSAGNPSTYLYRENRAPSNTSFTSGNFIGITNINLPTAIGTSDQGIYNIPIGNGILFFFRGAATNWSTRTGYPFIAPENVTLTATGKLNQGSVTVKNWYTPTSSYLGYTSTADNTAIRGFNMVGNPYACTIDWDKVNAGGIVATNIDPNIYVLNPVSNQYDAFSYSSHTGTFSGKIVSGQGFFVKSTTATASLIFNETAKSPTSQLTNGNLYMGEPVKQEIAKLLRLKMFADSANYDDIIIAFKSGASAKYSGYEDARDLGGMGALEGLSSFSSDNIPLAINLLALPKLAPVIIRLKVQAAVSRQFTLQRTLIDSLPPIYEVWLMDKYKKDSLDLRNNNSYIFNVDLADTSSIGSDRFSIVIRQNKSLDIHLLNFTAVKASEGAQIAWKTENEENYTNFTVERSTDNGVTFDVLGGFLSSTQAIYTFMDKNPAKTVDIYRLKVEDLNGTISYSQNISLIYGAANNTVAANTINVYPNPALNTINLAIKNNTQATLLSGLQSIGKTPSLVSNQSYAIKIVNVLGAIVKSATSSQPNWQDDVATLLPGTYIIQVLNNTDKSLVGKTTFVKM
ncbi:T9SS type A sorting domain-containing protein [Mucilaginibacter sp.]|uniref:T9SS type A sorting domain-containing protein n=1 Tax=Mucilaginibacter sp. TaxID=1882438 RepID=UPI002602D5DE|nr:T9SS type A sorting domain-containing protein [Mucilaginibacter sp.]MDB4920820.1 type sorting protein [Mucilaginibacter sp.]